MSRQSRNKSRSASEIRSESKTGKGEAWEQDGSGFLRVSVALLAVATGRAIGLLFTTCSQVLLLPGSRYYLRSLSRTSGTLLLPVFSGPSRGSRRTSLAERGPREDPLGSGRIP